MESLNKEERKKFEELEQIASRFFEQADVDAVREAGIEVDLYFDTYYILAMIQGYWELKTSVYKSFDHDIFKHDRFLVNSLAYFGYLKNIKVLLPHASELYNHIEKTYLLPSDTLNTKEIDEFLGSVGLDTIKIFENVNSQKQLTSYLHKWAPRAADIFKANYVLSELIWTRRFNYLFNSSSPVVRYDNMTYSTDEIIDTPLFHRIFNTLASGERERKTVNNLRDAVSLCMLKYKIDDFEKGKGPLPLLYLTSDVLAKMNADLRAVFTVTFEGRRISVLKDTEYFIIDAMFSAENNKNIDQNEILFKKFKKIKETFTIYSTIEERFPVDEIESLLTRWHEYRNRDFFERLWHDEKVGRVKLHENILALLQYDELVKHDGTFERVIQRDKEKLKDHLIEQVSDLVFLEEIWKEVGTFNVFMNRSINAESVIIQNEQVDVFRDGGLTRFSPSSGEVEEQIKVFWNGFMEHRHSDEGYFLRLKVGLTKLLYKSILKNNLKEYDKILIGLSILWMFRKYMLIIKLVEKLENDFGGRYQIPLIYMASILRLNDRRENQLKKIDNMIQCVESKSCYAHNYKTWLGLGYLKFNVWSSYSKAPIIPEEFSSEHTKKFDKYCLEGVFEMHRTFRYLSTIKNQDEHKETYRTVKYYYSLNSYVYYIIRSGAFSVFDDSVFFDHVLELENIQEDERYRQGRFSDTIAHYYYRKAVTTTTIASKLSHLESAKFHIQKAIDLSVVVDEKFNLLRNKIQVYRDSVDKEK